MNSIRTTYYRTLALLAIVFAAPMTLSLVALPVSAAATPAAGRPAPYTNNTLVYLLNAPQTGPTVQWQEKNARFTNIVSFTNTINGQFMFGGNVNYGDVRGDTVSPINLAWAAASCTDCQTIAVALQVVVYRRGARNVTPQNAAIAINTNCTRCVTVARAVQYVIPLDDPEEVPEHVDRLVKDMNRSFQEISQIHSLNGTSMSQVEGRINAVINQYGDLVTYLMDTRTESNRSNDQQQR